MKLPVKKILLTSAVVGAMLATTSSVSALGITETNRYGRTPNPDLTPAPRQVYVTNPNVVNVNVAGYGIPTEGTDFSQYYWRGDSTSTNVVYDEGSNTFTHTEYTIRYWEAK
ncbi:hypothetical protein ACVR1G_05055 [Streptococcus dentasini]